MADSTCNAFVELCTSLLMSNHNREVLRGYKMVKDAHEEDAEPEFARKAQELAAFQGGACLKVLFGRIAEAPRHPGSREYAVFDDSEQSPSQEDGGALPAQIMDECSVSEGIVDAEQNYTEENNAVSDNRTLMVPSSLALVRLADSKVVVECLVRDCAAAQTLAQEFAFNFRQGLGRLSSQEHKANPDLTQFFLRLGLVGFVHFMKSSKVCRETMKHLSNLEDIFEGFACVFTKKLAKRLRDTENICELRLLVSSIVASLALYTDSQTWAIDSGLLRVISAIYESTHRREISNLISLKQISERVGCPAFRCNVAIIRLVESEAALQRLRQIDALSSLKAHKLVINAVQPEFGPFAYIRARLLREPLPDVGLPTCPEPLSRSYFPEEIWTIMKRYTVTHAPPMRTVCSWNLCTEAPEPHPGAFSRCAKCGVARYCRREHQKLHWRTHKIHCHAKPVMVRTIPNYAVTTEGGVTR